MKLISFDVGIRNLAYCVISYTRKNDPQPKIIDWGVIDCIESLNDVCRCEYILKSKKQCVQNSKYTLYNKQNDGSYNYLCNKHYKELLIDKKLTGKYKDSLINVAKCNQFDIYSNIILSLEANKDKILPNDLTDVLIENQPRFNPKMKNISGLIYSFYMLRGIIDHQCENLTKILYVSPRRKGRSFEPMKKDLLTTIDLNKNTRKVIDKNVSTSTSTARNEKYKQTKNLGIEYCRHLLINFNYQDKLEMFNNHPKKDDLADSFIQGINHCTSF
jgi:hypothetical protein